MIDDVLNKYSFDKIIVASIIECCIKTKHFEEARKYIDLIGKDNYESSYKISNRTLMKLLRDETFRNNTISKYVYVPSMLYQCCFFGCPEHMTGWFF